MKMKFINIPIVAVVLSMMITSAVTAGCGDPSGWTVTDSFARAEKQRINDYVTQYMFACKDISDDNNFRLSDKKYLLDSALAINKKLLMLQPTKGYHVATKFGLLFFYQEYDSALTVLNESKSLQQYLSHYQYPGYPDILRMHVEACKAELDSNYTERNRLLEGIVSKLEPFVKKADERNIFREIRGLDIFSNYESHLYIDYIFYMSKIDPEKAQMVFDQFIERYPDQTELILFIKQRLELSLTWPTVL